MKVSCAYTANLYANNQVISIPDSPNEIWPGKLVPLSYEENMKLNKKFNQNETAANMLLRGHQRYLVVYMRENIPLRNMEEFDDCDDVSVDGCEEEINLDSNQGELLLDAKDFNDIVPFNCAPYKVGGEADNFNVATYYDAALCRKRRLVYRDTEGGF